MGVGGQRHAPTALLSGKNSGIHCKRLNGSMSFTLSFVERFIQLWIQFTVSVPVPE